MRILNSVAFFELNCDSFCGRGECLQKLAHRTLSLPLILPLKALRTGLRLIGLGISVILFAGTLGLTRTAREFLLRRVSILTFDLGDWIVFPFAVFSGLLRLALGGLIHPRIVFN